MPRIKNPYKVPNKQWKKWSSEGKETFNFMMSWMTLNQELLLHPKGVKNKKIHWHTTCWNAAWVAADFVTDLQKTRK